MIWHSEQLSTPWASDVQLIGEVEQSTVTVYYLVGEEKLLFYVKTYSAFGSEIPDPDFMKLKFAPHLVKARRRAQTVTLERLRQLHQGLE